jgi:NDP-sugar pyrophosphorylase family protein
MEGLKLNMYNIPLCILAAGRGSRLGAFTNAINKALLPVDGKAVISHIIDKAPYQSEIIVALGYQGQKVKDYCLIAHPQRKFIFVDVDNYGPNSGPAYSMWCCREYLQRPFYFCTVDCIIGDSQFPYVRSHEDWIGVSLTNEPQFFSTAKISWDDEQKDYTLRGIINSQREGVVVDFVNKKTDGFDYAFIGLAGIGCYEAFWQKLQLTVEKNEMELVAVFFNNNNLIAHQLTWLDTGTIENYAATKTWFEGNQIFDFDKVGEFTYFVNGKVIKYFDDENRVAKRVKRAGCITGTPAITDHRGHFFAYSFVSGQTLYQQRQVYSESLFNWLQTKLWDHTFPTNGFKNSCLKFYRDKTLERFEMYKKKKGIDKN